MRLQTTRGGERGEVSSNMPMEHAVTLTVTRYLRDVNHRAIGTRHLAGTTAIRLNEPHGNTECSKVRNSQKESNRGRRKTEGL